MSSRHSAMRCGASKNTSVRVSAASSASRARRSARRAGRNPSNVNRSVGSPAMLSAAVMAEGPGTATTVSPSCATRRTSSKPGSESKRRARIADQRDARAAAQALQQLVDALALVVFVQRHQWSRQPERCQQLPRPACVLGRDQFRGREFVARARRQVAEIADGRRDHRKAARVRSHYTSPPRLDSRPFQKAIRHMTAGKALHRFLGLTAGAGGGRAARGLPDHPTAHQGTSMVDRADDATRAGDHAGAAALYERLAAQAGSSSDSDGIPAARRARLAGRRPRRPMPIGCWPPSARAPRNNRLSNSTCCASSPRWRRAAATKPGAKSAPCSRRRRRRPRRATTKRANRWRSPPGTWSTASAPRCRASELVGPGDQRVARSELLGQLRAAAERGVSLTPPPGSDATMRGWLEAASVAVDNARNPTLGATRLARISRALPVAPGAHRARQRAQRRRRAKRPPALAAAPHLALILPLTGRTAAAAAQIRDGFMTAYYQLPANSRPRLRVYDSAVGCDLRHHRAGQRGRRRIHRRPADARGSRGGRRPPNYPAAAAGAQFPAGRPAATRALFPVRAVARRRRARGGALHRRHRPPPWRGDRARGRLGHARRGGFRRGAARRRRPGAGPVSLQRRGQGLRRGDHAGAAYRRQPRAPAAHPGHHRSEAGIRTATPRRHPVHLRAQPAGERRGCCGRSCATTWPATFPPTRSAMPTSRIPPPTRRSTA